VRKGQRKEKGKKDNKKEHLRRAHQAQHNRQLGTGASDGGGPEPASWA
jgi:hypothetical protein